MDYQFYQILLEILIGAIIGIVIGLTGVGGGALVQPALIHIIGLSPVMAIGTGFLYTVITKIWGTWAHYRLKNIIFRKVMFFLFGSIPSVLLTSKIINYAVENLDSQRVNDQLQFFMAFILLLTAGILIFQTLKEQKSKKSKEEVYLPLNNEGFDLKQKITAVIGGGVIGVIIGATSIGGGVLIIPLFILVLKTTVRQAIGSSILLGLILSAVGGIVYVLGGNVLYETAITMSIGSLLGVFIGGRLTVYFSDMTLKIIMIFMVLLSGISLFFGIGH